MTPPSPLVTAITSEIADAYPVFGGGKSGNGFNPLAVALQGHPASFAAGVEVRSVVAAVLESLARLESTNDLACPFCAHRTLRNVGIGSGYGIYRCSTCDAHFILGVYREEEQN